MITEQRATVAVKAIAAELAGAWLSRLVGESLTSVSWLVCCMGSVHSRRGTKHQLHALCNLQERAVLAGLSGSRSAERYWALDIGGIG